MLDYKFVQAVAAERFTDFTLVPVCRLMKEIKLQLNKDHLFAGEVVIPGHVIMDAGTIAFYLQLEMQQQLAFWWTRTSFHPTDSQINIHQTMDKRFPAVFDDIVFDEGWSEIEDTCYFIGFKIIRKA